MYDFVNTFSKGRYINEDQSQNIKCHSFTFTEYKAETKLSHRTWFKSHIEKSQHHYFRQRYVQTIS